MFTRHLIVNNGKNENLYLYINNYYEFSDDLFNSNIKKRTLFDIVYRYICLNKIKFNGKKIFLVNNGIVIGYILTKDILLNKPSDIVHYEFIYSMDNFSYFDNVEEIPELIDNYVTLNFNNI